MYLQVVQDGAAILNYKNTDRIQGLFTCGLETCTAIIIIGKEGIALIHDTGRLSSDSIVNIFKALGEIEEWAIAYNPKTYKDIYNDKLESTQKFHDMGGRYISELEKIIGKKSLRFIKVELKVDSDLSVIVGVGGAIDVEETPSIKRLTQQKDCVLRHNINMLNNFFLLSEGENCLDIGKLAENETIDVDIQYNGNKPGPFPTLKKNITQINEIIELPRFKKNVATSGLFMLFEYIYKNIKTSDMDIESLSREIGNILKKSTERTGKVLDVLKKCQKKGELLLPCYNLALRRAAAALSAQEVKIILEEAPSIDVNEQGGENKRTALHWSIIKGMEENAKILINAGADASIKDYDGKTSKDHAKYSNKREIKVLFD